ncbi:MAG TPA: hypothetical protein VFS05_11185 [Gemmatimonadaceae bacterium]|nr:hypothetical protein [Gemmatimonadaceae bacterium]
MIRVAVDGQPLSTPERWAVDLLLDLARLVPVHDPRADVVELLISSSPSGTTLEECLRHGWHLRRADGRVELPRAALQVVLDIAGCAVEQRSEAADRHGRVPSSENPLVRAECERDPVISRAALALRHTAIDAADRRIMRLTTPWPGGRHWAAAITHDVDVMRWGPLFAGMRVAELTARGEVARAAGAAGAALRGLRGDAVWKGIEEVLARETRRDIRATWFFLCGTPTLRTIRAGDLTYGPESVPVKRAVAAVGAAGHELGLHGSFATMLDSARFREQRERLLRVGARSVAGVRQHFLRMRPGLTQREMRQAGFEYDATFGFPDRNGFRLGVADIVPAWDEHHQAPLDLSLVPLIWMDRALSKYQRVEEPERWVEDGLQLARACRETNGLWVGLWHPNLVPSLGFPGAPRAFERLLDGITADEPYIAPLHELVTWRHRRRALRVIRVAEDGRAELAGAGAEPDAPGLELVG